MNVFDALILSTGIMLLLGIMSSKLSARLGLPVLVLFLLLGILAGEEGIGGIEFDNYELAYGIGSLALTVILFDGGLGTSIASVRAVLAPASILATVGVAVTAVVTGLAAYFILQRQFPGMTLYEGLLLGSIVGSTDAAVVFAILRHGGITLSKRLSATLEVESASNDPMAIFLTIGFVELIQGRVEPGIALLALFAKQMAFGLIAGIAIGYIAVFVINRIELDATGMYPVLVMGFAFTAFGMAVLFGGSGFLAVYLAGIILGNSKLVYQRGIRVFHDAAAWIAQILMFIVLGLLSSPGRLMAVAGQGLLVSSVLFFVARPLAVVAVLPFFRFNWKETTLVSWVGLKGAVPITLATFPLMEGLDRAHLLFDIVFFIVVLSATVQGWTLPGLARRLGLEQPAEPTPPVMLEIHSLRNVDGEVVDYTVSEDSRAAGRLVKDLALPEGIVIALIVRDQQVIPPHGKTRIEKGDHVIVVLRPDVEPLVTKVFAGRNSMPRELPQLLEFPLRPTVLIRELEEAYGIRLDAPADWTLAEAICNRIGKDQLHPGGMANFGPIALHIRGITATGAIDQLGMVILSPDQSVTANEPAAKAKNPATPSEPDAKENSPQPQSGA